MARGRASTSRVSRLEKAGNVSDVAAILSGGKKRKKRKKGNVVKRISLGIALSVQPRNDCARTRVDEAVSRREKAGNDSDVPVISSDEKKERKKEEKRSEKRGEKIKRIPGP